MINLSINGKSLTVAEGTTILEAAEQGEIPIPTLCCLKDISAVGSCRVCVVDIEGQTKPVPACCTVARDNMCIQTDSARVRDYRRMALELLLSHHALDATNYCFSCNKNGACELQSVCRECGVQQTPYKVPKRPQPLIDSNPLLSFDPNLCIRCFRCVGACNAAAYNHSLQPGKQGVRTTIHAPFGEDWSQSACESCGNCAQACPTGALTLKRRARYRSWETTKVRTTCPHCGVGCQLDLVVKDGSVVDAQGAPGPSNHSLLCVKGRSASFDFIEAGDRLKSPLIKNHETGEFEAVGWDYALNYVAQRFTSLRDEYGGRALGAFACSRATNEDIYLFQKMARVVLQTNNVDCCARV